MIKVIRKFSTGSLPPIITKAGIKMRNPMTPDGLWIGWTDEEVALHLATYNNDKNIIPPKEDIKPPKEENNNGCGRG